MNSVEERDDADDLDDDEDDEDDFGRNNDYNNTNSGSGDCVTDPQDHFKEKAETSPGEKQPQQIQQQEAAADSSDSIIDDGAKGKATVEKDTIVEKAVSDKTEGESSDSKNVAVAEE